MVGNPLAVTRASGFETVGPDSTVCSPSRGWPLTGPPRFSSTPVTRWSAVRVSS